MIMTRSNKEYINWNVCCKRWLESQVCPPHTLWHETGVGWQSKRDRTSDGSIFSQEWLNSCYRSARACSCTRKKRRITILLSHGDRQLIGCKPLAFCCRLLTNNASLLSGLFWERTRPTNRKPIRHLVVTVVVTVTLFYGFPYDLRSSSQFCLDETLPLCY